MEQFIQLGCCFWRFVSRKRMGHGIGWVAKVSLFIKFYCISDTLREFLVFRIHKVRMSQTTSVHMKGSYSHNNGTTTFRHTEIASRECCSELNSKAKRNKFCCFMFAFRISATIIRVCVQTRSSFAIFRAFSLHRTTNDEQQRKFLSFVVSCLLNWRKCIQNFLFYSFSFILVLMCHMKNESIRFRLREMLSTKLQYHFHWDITFT